MKKAIHAIWNYLKSMNSENGDISIKRNMAWGIATLTVFVEVFSLIMLPKTSESEMKMFIALCEFYTSIDLIFVAIALGITSLEKITALVTRLKAGLLGGGNVPDQQANEPTDPNAVIVDPSKTQP